MACFDAWDIGGCGCSTPTGVICVTCTYGIPETLSITDDLGSYTATWNSTLSLWITPALCSPSASALYSYSIGCTSANHMTLNRYWYEIAGVSPSYEYSPCGSPPGGPQAYSSSGSVAVTCGSISWSGTLTEEFGNLADPVGGTASFSQ
jgi:hypothetical protein